MVIVCLLWTTAAENGFENLIIAAMFRILSRGEAAVQKVGVCDAEIRNVFEGVHRVWNWE